MRTVDTTDIVALCLLHRMPALYVVLTAWNRATKRMDTAFVNVEELAACIEKSGGVSVPDFVMCSILRGTDFVDRCVRGAPEWGAYMRACAAHLRTTGVPKLILQGAGGSLCSRRARRTACSTP